ncbi:hypothetical protein IWZ03DRAFT_356034 [Phyllosticta citriasiana]|uniref:Uncharacterized protein n=1 Tax=Phyllosticta citriasiana TaxID=595635 RepID=A0ABR1KXU5_9PEZI
MSKPSMSSSIVKEEDDDDNDNNDNNNNDDNDDNDDNNDNDDDGNDGDSENKNNNNTKIADKHLIILRIAILFKPTGFNTPSYSYSTLLGIATSKALREGNNGSTGGKEGDNGGIGSKEGNGGIGGKDDSGDGRLLILEPIITWFSRQ